MPRKISHKLSKTVRPGFGGLQTAQEPDPIGSDANKARFALARENAFDLVMLDLTTRPLIGCSFYLRGGNCSLVSQIQAFSDNKQILSKLPQRASRRSLFGPVVKIGQTFFPEQARELAPKSI